MIHRHGVPATLTSTDARTRLAHHADRYRENAASLERIAERAERDAADPSPSMSAQRSSAADLAATCRDRASDWYALTELAQACSRLPAHYPAAHLVTALQRFARELES